MKIIDVYVEYASYSVDKSFAYLCDDESVSIGKRVFINFNNRDIIGFVVNVIDSEECYEKICLDYGYKLKYVTSVIDKSPLINSDLMKLAYHLQKITLAPLISVFQTMLPAKLKPASTNQKIKTEKFVRIKNICDKLSDKQQIAYDALVNEKEMKLTKWRLLYKSISKTLEDKCFVEQFDKQVVYINENNFISDNEKILNSHQISAMDTIENSDNNIVLLQGVTGCGKTEIYLQYASKMIKQKKQVLILVPEIALTPLMISRFNNRFKQDCAIYHSGLNNQEKYEQYLRVFNNEVNVVIGTRSAIFMPFENLGLIVMDEEHDSSYKQETNLHYHTRDVAIFRSKMANCKLILGSATPSVDSYARALKGVYQLVSITQRVNNSFADIICVNTKNEMKNLQPYLITNELKQKIGECLNRKQQIILLLNRRGYSPYLKCINCNETKMCPHCDLALNYHKVDNTLKCHCCGYTTSYESTCDHCNSKVFVNFGVGTQKLQEEVTRLFNGVKILRMDGDTVKVKGAHQKILNSFSNHEADILIGTQMIAKGLDFENVTLVGIVNADNGINGADFNVNESIFQLITQAAGRSGRGSKNGRVVVQVFDDNNYVVKSACNQDYVSFFNHEMKYRHQSNNPPYSYLISIVFSDKNKDVVESEISNFKKGFTYNNYKVLGPAEMIKLIDKYRYRVILKGKDLDVMRNDLALVLQKYKENKGKCNVVIDVNPTHLQ